MEHHESLSSEMPNPLIKKHVNVSSSATVFLKYFLPTIWTVFFGTLLVIFWFSDSLHITGIPSIAFKIWYTVFFVLGLLLWYFTVVRLVRVEMDSEYVYVTNYLKIFKYPYFNIEKVEIQDFGIFKTGRVFFVHGGHFGKRVTFVLHSKKFSEFTAMHPHIARKLTEKYAKSTQSNN